MDEVRHSYLFTSMNVGLHPLVRLSGLYC